MTKKKIDPLTVLKGEQGIETRNAAIVYLYEVKDYTIEMLAKLTTLAKSTVKSYTSKFRHLLDWAKKIFAKGKAMFTEDKKVFLCYIDKITLPNGDVWCKIGQTTQTPKERAKGFYWTINGKKVKPAAVEIQYTIKCKNATAMQNMEDCLRLGMTAINPDKYVKEDRLTCWEDDYPQRIVNNPFVQMGLEQFAA